MARRRFPQRRVNFWKKKTENVHRIDVARELGEQALLSTAAGYLAQAYYALNRLDKADAWAGRAAELGASDDRLTQMLWRQVKAKVLARWGEHDEAQRNAREAVALGEETDMIGAQADAYTDLGEVLIVADRPKEAERRRKNESRAA